LLFHWYQKIALPKKIENKIYPGSLIPKDCIIDILVLYDGPIAESLIDEEKNIFEGEFRNIALEISLFLVEIC